jgi:hypothetical protein
LTAQGHPRATFNRAIERGNLLIAETVLRELGRPTLGELLELTILIAFKDPRRGRRRPEQRARRGGASGHDRESI